MPLFSPVIIGPLTEWSSTILVQGCLPGAFVEIMEIAINPRTVAKGIANGGSDRISLISGESLKRYDVLVAVQTLGSETSPVQDFRMGVWVAPAPASTAEMSPLGFNSQSYECGQLCWLGGATAGAIISIHHGNNLLGKEVANEGQGFIHVSRIPPAGNQIDAKQEPPPGYTVPGPLTVTSAVTKQAPMADGNRLPAPKLNQANPVQGCDTNLNLSGLVDGGTLTLAREGAGIVSTYLLNYSSSTLILNPPLMNKADKLKITQALVDCQRRDSEELVIEVAEAAKPATPIANPPCAWSSFIALSNLSGGAIISVTVNGTFYQGMVPPDGNSLLVQVDPIPINSSISIVQQKCALISDPLLLSTVDNIPLKKASVLGPLFNCGKLVRVVDATPGSMVQIWAALPDPINPLPRPISDPIPVWSESLVVYLKGPYLITDQWVFVQYLACGGNWKESPRIQVTEGQQTSSPIVNGIEGEQKVEIEKGLPGAYVEVYAVNGGAGELLGTGYIDPLHFTIGLNRPLRRDDEVFCIQRLCQAFDHSIPVRVLPSSRSFTMPAPARWPSDVKPYDKFMVADTATLTLKHNSDHSFTGHFTNTEEEADVDYFLFRVTVNVANRPGQKWSREIIGNASAAGNGPATLVGLRTLGIPSSQSFSAPAGNDPQLTDIGYWRDILQSSADFKFFKVFFHAYPDSEPDDPDDD